MKCKECGHETDKVVCKNCGLVLVVHPIARNDIGYTPRRVDITTLHSVDYRSWEHPLSPNIRKKRRDFIPRYQKKYIDYVYLKAYESITKLCSQLNLTKTVKFEALNLFKGIRDRDDAFFKHNKLAPTYLAAIKIACKIHDFPISNYELASVIDYESNIDMEKNVSYMEKKFNRSYRELIKLYKLEIPEPEHPNFINYACHKLDQDYPFIKKIHNIYTKLKPIYQPHFRKEGYILAIIYLCGNGRFTLKQLEELFHTSSITISNRKNEILNKVRKK